MRKKIGVIEDDLDIREIIRFLLKDTYDIVFLSDHMTSEEFTREGISVLIMEVRLARGSGNAICSAIKNDSSSRHIQVILMSTNLNISKIATACGADAYIDKPFDIDDLFRLVTSLT